MTIDGFMQYIIDYMRQYEYIEKGSTRALTIDFTMMWPGEPYVYVNTFMLFEFSAQG